MENKPVLPEKYAWVKPGVYVWYYPEADRKVRYAGIVDNKPPRPLGTEWVVQLVEMDYAYGKRGPAAAHLDCIEARPMHRFQDIPLFPRAHYEVTIEWGYLEEYIERQSNERKAPLNLEPDFQRAHVWTKAQQVAYVEYCLKGGEVGRALTFNCPGWMGDWRGPYEIVDGKQRLEAVRAFLRDEVKAFGLRRSEFKDNLRMVAGSFLWRVCAMDTRADVLKFYLNINAGGTPHSPEELERVRALLKEELRNAE